MGATLILPMPSNPLIQRSTPRSIGELLEKGLQYHVARPVNVLVMGIDRVPTAAPGSPEIFSGRSDTMLLIRVDPTENAVSLLSIPRDTQVDIPEVGLTKINDANVRGGADLAAQTVSRNLNGVEIHRYVRVSTDAFRELVDLLGGLEVNVPRDMSYEDKTQKLKIDLKKGLQTLDGNQAEQFARFRQDDFGDIGRVQRQQILLQALRKRLSNPLVIPRIPSIISSMQKYIDTNLSVEEMLALVSTSRTLAQNNLRMVLLPGRFSAPGEFKASYWIMDQAGRDRVLQQSFKVEAPAGTESENRAGVDLRITLQNASSRPEALAKAQQALAEAGYKNVVLDPNPIDIQRQTRIIAQQGDVDEAQTLRKLLKLGKVEASSTGDLESDLTILVGEDWSKRFKDAEK